VREVSAVTSPEIETLILLVTRPTLVKDLQNRSAVSVRGKRGRGEVVATSDGGCR